MAKNKKINKEFLSKVAAGTDKKIPQQNTDNGSEKRRRGARQTQSGPVYLTRPRGLGSDPYSQPGRDMLDNYTK